MTALARLTTPGRVVGRANVVAKLASTYLIHHLLLHTQHKTLFKQMRNTSKRETKRIC